MATVKGRRPHEDQRGQARTRLARRAVVEAARALFLERGYAATTIDAISDRSDVPPATIYRLFSSKLGILTGLLDVSIAGDDEALSVQDQPRVAALFAEPDPEKLLAGFARINVAINSRSGPIYRILVSAAASDPEAAALHAEYQRQRDQGQGQIARALARAGSSGPGCENATPQTSSTPSCPPTSTVFWSRSEAGRLSATNDGWQQPSSTSCFLRRRGNPRQAGVTPGSSDSRTRSPGCRPNREILGAATRRRNQPQRSHAERPAPVAACWDQPEPKAVQIIGRILARWMRGSSSQAPSAGTGKGLALPRSRQVRSWVWRGRLPGRGWRVPLMRAGRGGLVRRPAGGGLGLVLLLAPCSAGRGRSAAGEDV